IRWRTRRPVQTARWGSNSRSSTRSPTENPRSSYRNSHAFRPASTAAKYGGQTFSTCSRMAASQPHDITPPPLLGGSYRRGVVLGRRFGGRLDAIHGEHSDLDGVRIANLSRSRVEGAPMKDPTIARVDHLQLPPSQGSGDRPGVSADLGGQTA